MQSSKRTGYTRGISNTFKGWVSNSYGFRVVVQHSTLRVHTSELESLGSKCRMIIVCLQEPCQDNLKSLAQCRALGQPSIVLAIFKESNCQKFKTSSSVCTDTLYIIFKVILYTFTFPEDELSLLFFKGWVQAAHRGPNSVPSELTEELMQISIQKRSLKINGQDVSTGARKKCLQPTVCMLDG